MSLMWQEITQQPEVIENCLSLNRKTIDAIVARLENKAVSNVIIAARGTSDHAGIYGKYIIEIKKGIPVSLAAPSVFTIYDKNVDMSDSLVIAISQSGRNSSARRTSCLARSPIPAPPAANATA